MQMQITTYPHEPIFYTVPAMTRMAMVAQLQSHGWRVETTFNQLGPVLLVDGPWSGTLSINVPVRLIDDHSQALRDVYSLIGQVMVNIQGHYGRA
jgi:hypothetical protein